MIVLLAVAIARVADHRFESIDCAFDDADRVYDSLSRVCGSAFDARKSSVVRNPTSGELLGTLSGLALALDPGDQLVVYFSGHADEREGMARLLFANADDKGRGRMRVDVLAAPLVDASVRSILVLDCCNSGNALTVADTRDALFPRRISVVASAGPYLPANHSKSGSPFTLALCRALDDLAERGSDLSISNIVSLVESDRDFEGRVHVNHPSGSAGEVFMSDTPSYLIPEDASKRFIDKVASVDVRTRESLWYALQEMPLPLQLEVLQAACLDDGVDEASWLVRRAIGSVISSLPEHSRTRRELIISLLADDRSWMQNAIGVVAGREDVARDVDMQREFLRIIRTAKLIDIVWLVHLYSADFAPDEALDAVLQTGMVGSRWGLLDIFRRHQSRFRGDVNELIERLRDAAIHEEHLDSIKLHLTLTGADAGYLTQLPIDQAVADSAVARSLYRKRPRGRIRQSRAKWLLSYLYGDWRDQIGDDVVQVLDEVPTSQRLEQAALLARLPAVEMRMALARETATGFRQSEEFAIVHEWASRDIHPWVRRESVSSEDRGRRSAAFDAAIDRETYPGVLDLAIAGIESGTLPADFEERMDLTVSESKSLGRYSVAIRE